MRRAALIVLPLAVALAVPLAAGAAKHRTTFSFTSKIVGAQISPTEAVFKIKDSREGRGAGTQKVVLDGTKGTDTDVTYYKHGSARAHGSFKLGTVDADGIATITGKGHDTGGTERLKGFHSTYTVTGTFNSKTLVYEVTLKGTGSLPR